MFENYHSKSITVKAVQFTHENKNKVFNSLSDNCLLEDSEDGKPFILVQTIHNDYAVVRLTDWIVEEEVPGLYYPVKDGVFQRKYYV